MSDCNKARIASTWSVANPRFQAGNTFAACSPGLYYLLVVGGTASGVVLVIVLLVVRRRRRRRFAGASMFRWLGDSKGRPAQEQGSPPPPTPQPNTTIPQPQSQIASGDDTNEQPNEWL